MRDEDEIDAIDFPADVLLALVNNWIAPPIATRDQQIQLMDHMCGLYVHIHDLHADLERCRLVLMERFPELRKSITRRSANLYMKYLSGSSPDRHADGCAKIIELCGAQESYPIIPMSSEEREASISTDFIGIKHLQAS